VTEKLQVLIVREFKEDQGYVRELKKSQQESQGTSGKISGWFGSFTQR